MNAAASAAAPPILPRRLIYLLDLVRELVVRDLKIRYKRSILGILWALALPLAQMLVFGFLFGVVLPSHVSRFSSYVLSGLLAWSWLQSSLILAAGSITANRDLIKRPGFPAAVLPGVTVTTNLIHFVLALPVLFGVLLADGTQLTPAVLTLPLIIALQFVVTLGVAYAVAALNVTVRDTGHILILMLMLVFYLTPVFYDASLIPVAYQPIYNLNPIVQILAAYRSVLLYGQLPDWKPVMVLLCGGMGLLWLGYRAFARASLNFVEEL